MGELCLQLQGRAGPSWGIMSRCPSDAAAHGRGLHRRKLLTLAIPLVALRAGIDWYMKTAFDLFSPRSWPAHAEQPLPARANRVPLSSVTPRNGLTPYPYECWRFTMADEPYLDACFDFPVDTVAR